MTGNSYNRFNFHRNTFCVFSEVDLQAVENKKADYISKSGSSYFFTDKGVFRLSNHWGRAANCKWRLQSNSSAKSRTKLGYADWTSFCPDNEIESLYFITINFDTGKVDYLHKNNEAYKPEYVLRTVADTTKKIRTIRGLYANESWAKYYSGNIHELRQHIIEQLITTDKTLLEIKQSL